MTEEKVQSESLYFIDDDLNDDLAVKEQGTKEPKESKATTTFDYKTFLKTVPNRPGSYRMYDKNETVIYVGKAKDLKKRLSQYFLKGVDSVKRLMALYWT